MHKKANAIEKALEILLLFSPHNRDLGNSEISRRLGFHKATTSRILLTLADYGFIIQDPQTKKFRLGHSIYKLGLAVSDTSINRIVRVTQPDIDALRDELDETIVLELWSGNDVVPAYISENTRPIRVAAQLGKAMPVHAAAGAKAILSMADPEVVESLIQHRFPAYTSKTITDSLEFRRRLEIYKQQGFAVDDEEIDIGISAVGAPLLNHENRPFAAIVVVTPTQRFTDDPTSKTITSLLRVTGDISAKFFYQKNDNGRND